MVTTFTVQSVPAACFDEQVSDRDLAIIARDHLTDWEALCPFLELSCQQKKEIRNSFTDNAKQKQECLEVWKETHGKKATYQTLIKAAENAKAQDVADKVEAMFKNRLTAQPPQLEGKSGCGVI